MTRSSKNWHGRPGGWDSTHVQRQQFYSSNTWGFPNLEPERFKIEDWRRLLSYTHRDDDGRQHAESICHFFLDDYRFEICWTRPDTGLNRVRRFWGALTPDFSLYADWPKSIKIWNTYRSRWLGRWWQEHGVRVIPTVNWSDQASFDWCFLSIQRKQVVAISVPDLRDQHTTLLFKAGFDAMINHLNPSRILVYGKMPFQHPLCLEYQPDWERLREIRPGRRKRSNHELGDAALLFPLTLSTWP